MGEPELFRCLPSPLLAALRQSRGELEEIHLRRGRRTEVVAGQRSVLLEYRATERDLRVLLEAATGYSLYAAQNYLREGFCTTRDGCRLGLTGTVARDGDGAAAIHDLSSLNLRVAHEIRGCADEAARRLRRESGSVLITGAPGCGKTTLLRDLIRQIAETERVAVADERFELGAACQGVPALDLGERTNVLSGGKKEESIMMLLRTMNPQWIAVDEITCEADVLALEKCACCGVRLLATAHADGLSDLRRRPVYRKLLSLRLFENLIELQKNRAYTWKRMEETEWCG